MDRLGNSLDRSLLLADLIARTGRPVRLAYARLSPDQVALLSAVLLHPWKNRSRGSQPADSRGDGFAADYAARFGGDAAMLAAQLASLRSTSEAAGRSIAVRAAAQSAVLLRLAEKRLLSPIAQELAEPITPSDHWWVQVRVDGRWTSLDPAGLVDAGGEGINPDRTIPVDQLEESLYHKVNIRVLIACLVKGEIQQRLVLEHTLRVSNLLGVPIRLSHIPVKGADRDLTALSAVDPGPALVQWLATQSEWLPVLTVGTEVLTSQRFTRAGELLPAIPVPASVGGMLDAFGGGEESTGPSGALAGEWLEFEVRSPGAQPRAERRVLFDWTGFLTEERRGTPTVTREWADAALDLTTETEVLVLGAQPSAEYIAYQAAGDAIHGRADLLRVLRSASGAGAAPTAATEHRARSLQHLNQFALARYAWSPEREASFLANLTSSRAMSGW